MANNGGKGGKPDVIINAEVRIDKAALEKEVGKAVAGVGTELSKKKGRYGFGGQFAKSLFGPEARNAINKEAEEVYKTIGKVKSNINSLQKEGKFEKGGNLFLDHYKQVTKGITSDLEKLKAIERHLTQRAKGLQTLLQKNTQLASVFSGQNIKGRAPKTALDIAAALPDEKRLQMSARRIKQMDAQLRDMKDYISDLKTLRKAAKEAGDISGASSIGSLLGPLERQYGKYAKAADLGAAQARVDKGNQVVAKGLQQREKLIRDFQYREIQAARKARKEQEKLGAEMAKDTEAEIKKQLDGLAWAEGEKRKFQYRDIQAARKQAAERAKLIGNQRTERDIVRRKTEYGRSLIDRAGGLGNFSARGLDFDQVQAARKAATSLQGYYSKRAADIGIGNMGYDRAAAQAQKYGEAVRKLTEEHARLGGSLGTVGSLLRNFLRYAVGYQVLYSVINAVGALAAGVRDLNAELKNIQAITAGTDQDMEMLAGSINRVAISTKFSTNEIAQAAKVLSQAGFSPGQMPGVLKAVADFAAATDSSLSTAADTLSTMKEIYRDMSENEIANQLTKAVNISKLSGEDLQTILSLGAQVAQGYNVTSEQFLSAVTVLRNAGIKASTVATGLRQAMLEVFNPDDPTVQALQEQYMRIGENLSAEEVKAKFANFTNAVNPLVEAMQELERLGLGTAEGFGLNRGFDTRALNVLQAMVGKTNELIEAQNQITFGQAAAEGSATAMESLNAQWDNFTSAINALTYDNFHGFVESVAEAVGWMTDLIEKKREFDLIAEAGGERGKLKLDKIGGGQVDAVDLPKYGWGAVFESLFGNRSERLKTQASASARLYGDRQAAFEEMKARAEVYGPSSTGERSIGEQIRKQGAFSSSYLDRLDSTFSTATEEEAAQIWIAIAEKNVGMLKKLATNSEEINEKWVEEANKQTKEWFSMAESNTKNAISFMKTIRQASDRGDEAAKKFLSELATSGIDIDGLLSGDLMPGANIETFKSLFTLYEQVLKTMPEYVEAERKALEAETQKVKAEIDAALANEDEKASLRDLFLQYQTEVSSLGTDAAKKRLEQIKSIFAAALAGLPADQAAVLNQLASGYLADLDATVEGKVASDLKAEQERNLPKKPIPVAAKRTEFVPSVEAGSRVAQLDFEIEKIKKFGGGVESLTSLVQEKNRILAAEQQREIAHIKAQSKIFESDKQNQKDQVDLAEAEIKLQKIELQAKEDYLDALMKGSYKELQAFNAQRDAIMAKGGDFSGVGDLNAAYAAKQAQVKGNIRNYMKGMGYSDEEIQTTLDSDSKLNAGIFTDKQLDNIRKETASRIKAANTLVPDGPTTGDAYTDALARSGAGFTRTEQLRFAQDSLKGRAGQRSVYQQLITRAENLKKNNPDEAMVQNLNDEIAVYLDNIKEIDDEMQNLQVTINEFSTTAGGELASVFNEEGIRHYITALEESGNVLKDWGENIRGSLLKAWDEVGDAIADAVLEGKNFKESMKEIVKSMASDIFRMTTKNMMNNLMLGLLGEGYGGGKGGQQSGGGNSQMVTGILGFLGSLFGGGSSSGMTAASSSALSTNLSSRLGNITFNRNGAIIPKYATGYVRGSGVIAGPGSGTSDSLRGLMATKSGISPIAVSSGESILTAKATSLLGEDTIKALNSGTRAKFSAGGLVAEAAASSAKANLQAISPSVTVMPPPPAQVTLINSIDSPSVVKQGLKGSARELLNEISANKSAFKQVLR